MSRKPKLVDAANLQLAEAVCADAGIPDKAHGLAEMIQQTIEDFLFEEVPDDDNAEHRFGKAQYGLMR